MKSRSVFFKIIFLAGLVSLLVACNKEPEHGHSHDSQLSQYTQPDAHE